MNKKSRKDLDGVTVNGIPVSVEVNRSQGKTLYDTLKHKVHRYHKPILRNVEKRRPAPVKRYSRGAINQSYGKQAAIDACKAGKSSSYVALLLLLTGKPIKSRDILDIYESCSRKVSGPTVSGTLKRISSSPIASLLKNVDESGRIVLQLQEEAVGVLPEDLRKLANRMNKYGTKEFLQAYPELEHFYAENEPVSQNTVDERAEDVVRVAASTSEALNESITDALKKVEDVVTAAASSAATAVTKDGAEQGLLVRIAPVKLHFTFDFNINVNLNK